MAKAAATLSPADIITNAIIAKLEAGVRPWVQSWRPGGSGRPLRANGEAYRGINCFWLWMVAESHGFLSRTWMTYKQAASPMTGEASDEQRRVLRVYRVFNADQIEGLPDQYYPPLLTAVPPSDVLSDRAQQFLDRLPAKVRQRGDSAYYDRIEDAITMPEIARFKTRAAYAATLGHEAVHWSGHPDRLDREFGKKFGDQAYGFEELVAECGAALLGADLGLPTDHLKDHAAYIGSWLKILKKDSRAVLTAAAKAEAAASYLLHATGLDAAVSAEPEALAA